MNSDSSLARILVVEDDPAIGIVLRDTLTDSGYSCVLESDGVEGLKQALDGTFDLLILDLNLPRLSGLDICHEVKLKHPLLPIIMLTARNTEADVVAGLEKGADDYIAKPCRPNELLARVRARLRDKMRRMMASIESKSETTRNEQAQTIVLGALAIDPDRLRVTKHGVPIELSAREFDFLYLLASNPGRPFRRNVLLQQLWDMELENYDPNISVFVSRLRKKIEDDPDAPRYLLTVHGVGYRFAEVGEL